MFFELGVAIVGLALLARVASRWAFSAIPLYLLAGLAFGQGGVAPLSLSQNFIQIGAEIGVLLLLFMLGLEYTGVELKASLRSGMPAGFVDLLLNFPPGMILGWLVGWSVLPSVLLGGATYVSSSGIVAKVLSDLKRVNNRETAQVLSILVLEDLAMAIYLPLVAALFAGGGAQSMALSISIAIATVGFVLFLAVRYGESLSRLVSHESDEVILLTAFGALLLVAGAAHRLQVSSAVGAFLVGIAVSGPMAEQTHRIFAPLRDLFAATFFFFFGLQINPATLLPALPAAIGLGLATAATKIASGYWAARRGGGDRQAGLRAGAALVARGEFSIVIAGLGTAIEPALGPLSAGYVLFTAILGPILTRAAK